MSLSRYSYVSPKIKSFIPLVSNSTMILHCHFSKTPKEIKMQRTPLTRSITICWQKRPSQAQKMSMGQPSTRTAPAPAAKKPLLTILYWLFTLPEKQLRKGSNACPNHPDLRSHRQTHQTQHHCSSNQHSPHTNSSSISVWRDIASWCHLQLLVVDLIHWISMASELYMNCIKKVYIRRGLKTSRHPFSDFKHSLVGIGYHKHQPVVVFKSFGIGDPNLKQKHWAFPLNILKY